MPRLGLLLCPAAVVVGLAAEQVAYGWGDSRWVPDLTTGWAVVACGVVAWECRPHSRVGALLVVTGFSWFVVNFAASGVAGVGWLAGYGAVLHRGPLVHLLLAYPTGRLRSGRSRVVVGIYYVAALASVWRSDVASIILAVLLVGYVVVEYRRSVGPLRRARLLAVQVTGVLGVVLAIGAGARLVVSSGDASGPVLLAYQVVLIAGAAALVAGLLSRRWEQAAVTDLVVELGHARGANLRTALARALGDPTLQVGYRVPGSLNFLDSAGVSLAVPPAGSGRVTRLDRDGQPVAVVLHDAAVLDDPGLVEAVAAAARLAAANVELQAAVRTQLADVHASRRRIVDAAEVEGGRLEQRLHDGPVRRLLGLADALATRRGPGGSDPVVEHIESRLATALDELRRLGHGLHPRTLSERGLAAALTAASERCPLPTTVALTGFPVPVDLEPVVYFVCAEALTNVAKYSRAASAAVTVSVTSTSLVVTVTDDGIGGADPTLGSGLSGLADRVDTFGGQLQIASPTEQGTTLVATIPLLAEIR